MKKKLMLALVLGVLLATVITGAASANGGPGNGGNPNGGCVSAWLASPAASTAAAAYMAQYGVPHTKPQRMAMASTLHSLAVAACAPPPPAQ